MSIEVIEKEEIYPLDYEERMKAYNKGVAELNEKRKKFIEENPDHPFKNSMFLNVIAPPQKCIIREIKIINK